MLILLSGGGIAIVIHDVGVPPSGVRDCKNLAEWKSSWVGAIKER
jgi:hypothetical protein